MATPDELRQNIAQARAAAEAAIRECNEKWETKPASGGEGEESWCAKEAAQHVIGADYFFTNMISQACGAPAMERPSIDVSTPEKAVESLTQVAAANDKVLRHVSEGDLSKTFETRNLGTRSVQEMLEIMASHAQDHAQQIRAASA